MQVVKEPQTLKMSFEEYMAWADEDSNTEWVRGEVIAVSPESSAHQEVVAFLNAILRLYVRRNKLGIVRFERFTMRLPQIESAREPDILFVSTANAHRCLDTYVDGPADLVIEVVSLESRDRDTIRKFGEYERGGVPEYWVIDPARDDAMFYVLNENGRYEAAPVAEDGYYSSRAVSGFRINPEWLWQDPLPDELEILSLVATKSE